MSLQKLIDELKSNPRLQGHKHDKSVAYHAVDSKVFDATVAALKEFDALLNRIEDSAKSMEDKNTGRFIAMHLRQLVQGPIVTEAEAYGDEDGLAGCEAGVEYEEI